MSSPDRPEEKKDLFEATGELKGGYDMGMAQAFALEHAKKTQGEYVGQGRQRHPLIWNIDSSRYDEDAECFKVVLSCHPEGIEAQQKGTWEYHVRSTGGLMPGTPLLRQSLRYTLPRARRRHPWRWALLILVLVGVLGAGFLTVGVRSGFIYIPTPTAIPTATPFIIIPPTRVTSTPTPTLRPTPVTPTPRPTPKTPTSTPTRTPIPSTVTPLTAAMDQSFTSLSNLGAAINECCKFVAQTFTAGLAGTLAAVNIDVTSSSKFPLHVAIRTVMGGVPGSVLGETTLSSSSASLSQAITFPQTIKIVAGTQYAIVVDYQGAPSPGPGQEQGNWQGATGNAYAGGGLYFSVAGTSWFVSGADSDVHFRTYVNVSPTPLPPTRTPTATPTPIKPTPIILTPAPSPPGTITTFNFNAVATGDLGGNTLASFNIWITRGSLNVGPVEPKIMVVPQAVTKVAQLLGPGFPKTVPHCALLAFADPTSPSIQPVRLTSFTITRIGTTGGASLPAWRMRALDAAGNQIGTAVGEGPIPNTTGYFAMPAAPTSFRVAGPGISQVEICAHNTVATWGGLPIAQIGLSR